MAPHRPIGPWRTSLQWAVSLAVLSVPFVRVRGDSLLRVDLASRSLILLGRSHPLEQMVLLLLLCLSLVLLFLLATLVLGRVWCGWACPQTTLTDLTDALSRRLGVAPRRRGPTAGGLRLAALHGAYVGLALLVASNLVWYFVSPYDFFHLLSGGNLPRAVVAAMAAVGAAVYADLAFIRRTACTTFCPYGRFQAALADTGTLTLQTIPGNADRCIECGACTRACPTGVDIRQGQQIQCINCGRCLDACVEVMARRGEPGLIGYAFGRGPGGRGALLNARTVILAAAAVGALGAFATAALRWAPASLTVRRSPATDRLLPDGRTAAFFTAVAANRTGQPVVAVLSAETPSGSALELKGPTGAVALGPGERTQLDVAVVLPLSSEPGAAPVVFRLRTPDGRSLAQARMVAAPGLRP